MQIALQFNLSRDIDAAAQDVQAAISRAARQCAFPAQFQFVAAMNPCPCGWLGDPSGRCRCAPDHVARYRGRVSGPLLDRLQRQATIPDVQCRFRWAPGSVAFWDNRATQHVVSNDFLPARRIMERVTIVGDRPY